MCSKRFATEVPAPGAAASPPAQARVGEAGPEKGDGGNGDSAEGGAAVAPARLDVQVAPLMDRIDQQFSHFQEDAPACDVCGAITVRNGNCYKCFNCGSSLGCS